MQKLVLSDRKIKIPVILFEFVFLFLLDIYSGVELLGHIVVLFLVFSGTSILFSTVTVPIYIPTNSVLGFDFLHPLQDLSTPEYALFQASEPLTSSEVLLVS